MDYSYLADTSSSASAGAGILSTIISLLFTAVGVAAMWFIFVKAGEPGWAAIIPFYNTWVMFRLVYGEGWKCLLLLVPILNIAVSFSLIFRMPQAFGLDWKWGLLYLFLPPVFILILAFGPATYRGPATSSFL